MENKLTQTTDKIAILEKVAKLEKMVQDAKTEVAKKQLKLKIAELKKGLREGKVVKDVTAKQLASSLLASRKKFIEMTKKDFNAVVRALAKNPAYSFLKVLTREEIINDIQRKAKPVGWRFKGRGNYATPTATQIKKRPNDVYYEERWNKSDVSRSKQLASGGEIDKKYSKGGSVTIADLNAMIKDYNANGRSFELSGAYGNYELWSKGKRLEVGSKKDIYNALVKYRYNEKYAKGGNLAKKKITLIFDGKPHTYDVKVVDGFYEDTISYSKSSNPLYDFIRKDFNDWFEHESTRGGRSASELEEMYYGDDAIYSVNGAIEQAIDDIRVQVLEELHDNPNKTTWNLDKGEIDFGHYYAKGGSVKKNSPMSYVYETPKVRIAWMGKIQPLGVFKSYNEALEVIKVQSRGIKSEMEKYTIVTPDKNFHLGKEYPIKFNNGGEVTNPNIILSFSFNQSNVKLENITKVVEKYTKDWRTSGDVDETNIFITLRKDKAVKLRKEIKSEFQGYVYDFEMENSRYQYANGGSVKENQVSGFEPMSLRDLEKLRESEYSNEPLIDDDLSSNPSGVSRFMFEEDVYDFAKGGSVNTDAILKKLTNAIDKSQEIEGYVNYDVTNTKEIAKILGVSTLEAYKAMIDLESKGFAFKYGYKTKEGWEDPSNSSLQTNSLYWQISVPIGKKYAKGGSTDTSIAEEIGRQLGGINRLKMMTGAYNFGTSGNNLSFRIKNKSVNYINIKLNGKDLYDVEFGRIRANDYKVVKKFDDVYFDQLIPLFEKNTGMYLRFAEGGLVGYANQNYDDKIGTFNSLFEAKKFAKANKWKYETMTFEDDKGDNIVVTKSDTFKDIDWLFSDKRAKGGEIGNDFGYHVINKEVELKDGRKKYLTKGRYYWSNELGDGRVSGVYYLTNDGELVSGDMVKFPIYAEGGGVSSFLSKAKSIGKKGLEKTKSYAKGKIHDQKKKVALDVLSEMGMRANVSRQQEEKIINPAYDLVYEKYAKGGKMTSVYEEGGNVGEGFTIREMKEKLDKMFPYSFGFEVHKLKFQYNTLRQDKMSPLRGLTDNDIKQKLYFPLHHDIHLEIYQGGENTYFYFVLVTENYDYYMGTFGFKDRGDVPKEYVTKFLAFLMQQYGFPFQVKHSVYEKGGKMMPKYGNGGEFKPMSMAEYERMKMKEYEGAEMADDSSTEDSGVNRIMFEDEMYEYGQGGITDVELKESTKGTLKLF